MARLQVLPWFPAHHAGGRMHLLQIKGDAQRGTLKFVPLHLQRVDAASDSVQFAPAAFTQLLGLGNGTDAGSVALLA